MKKLCTLFVITALTFSVFAQSPEKMSYQFVVRNATSGLVTNSPVGVRIAILQGSATGTIVYQELFNPNPQTNANGLVSLEIGTGLPITGTFSGINWAAGPYFLKTETDPAGGTNYTVVGTSELLSVPYAFYARMAQEPMNNSVTSAKIADGTIITQDLANSIITSVKIANGTITDDDVSSSANINISKILGAAGIKFTYPSDYKVWTPGQIQMQTLATITMDIPSNGYVLLIHSGYVSFSSFKRVMELGVGTNATGMINNLVRAGTLDGTSTNRYLESYCVAHVSSVAKGLHTYYANACGESTFSEGTTTVTANAFIGVFIPLRY